MVSLAWPWALLALPLPLLLLRRLPEHPVTDGIRPPPLVAHALAAVEPATAAKDRFGQILAWLAWTFLVLAIAQPTIVSGKAMRPASGRAIVMAVDLSSSMERTDFELDGKPVDRLTAFRSVASRFVEGRGGDRIGLVLFGETAFAAVPVSYDLAAVANAIEEAGIGMAGRTTAIGDAIGIAIVKLRQDPASESTIVLMSDGANNAGTAEPEDAARLARQFGIRIHAVGMASSRKRDAAGPLDPAADLDEQALRRIAEIADGRFFRARTTEELAAIYAEIDRIEPSEADAPPVTPALDLRNVALAALALVLAGIAVRRRG